MNQVEIIRNIQVTVVNPIELLRQRRFIETRNELGLLCKSPITNFDLQASQELIERIK